MRKSIKNYTSRDSVNKSLAGIQEMLSKKGAESIMINYTDSEPSDVAFVMTTSRGKLPVKLPARIEKVEQIFLNNKKDIRSNRYRSVTLTAEEKAQAKRTAWKNLHDWVDAQLALVETEMVRMEEIFLPYSIMNGKTLFEHFDSGTLQLGSGKESNA